MKINTTITEAATRYAKECLTKDLGHEFLYHNLSHTLFVVKAVETLCKEMKFSNTEKKILLLAAWFHDLGYTQHDEEHEKSGAMLAENFLKQHNVDKEDIETVRQCILATHYPQQPLTTMQMVLCDADMMHLAERKCRKAADQLRKEWEITKGEFYTNREWYELNISFMTAHTFHTAYGKTVLEKGKRKNIKKMSALLAGSSDDKNDHVEILPGAMPAYLSLATK